MNHVRISSKGWRLLQNKLLAREVLATIDLHRKEFISGKPIKVEHENNIVMVRMTTAMKATVLR